MLTLFIPSIAFGAEKLQIYTVNYPLAYFAERIAGDQAEVVFPVPPDTDPAFWMPDAKTIADYQGADLILLNGAGYAKWTANVSLPRLRLVDTSRGFKDAYIEVEEAVSHNHGRGSEHSHGGTAFTTWLDLHQAAMQAEAIQQALVRIRPEAKAQFESNHNRLKTQLFALDGELQAIVATAPDRPLLASHPVYQYLSRRYGVNLQSFMWEPDAVPTETEWQALDTLLEKYNARWMLWETEPLPEVVTRLKELGVTSIVFKPCAMKPQNNDYISTMKNNIARFRTIFE